MSPILATINYNDTDADLAPVNRYNDGSRSTLRVTATLLAGVSFFVMASSSAVAETTTDANNIDRHNVMTLTSTANVEGQTTNIDSGINSDTNSGTNSRIDSRIDNHNQQSLYPRLYPRLYSQLRQQALQQKLAEHPTWRRLLYYTEQTNSRSKVASQVDNPEFFISPEGKTNAQAELEALLELILVPTSSLSATDKLSRQTTLCRFPARRYWLQSQLDIPNKVLDEVHCPEFDAWMEKLDAQRLSVVFAGEYLDNPLSAFAHTLMLIDSTKSLADPANIDAAHALNDTVAGSPDDNFVVYAGKSIIGAYPNDITIDPYPQKLAYYLKKDSRDVWTYPLALTQAEVQQIMRHVWETKDLGLPYYFTTDNCASEILRYIDVVRPESSLLSQLPYVVVPSDVVRLLTKEGLITEQSYLPADNTLKQAKRNAAATAVSEHAAVSMSHTLPDSVISKDNKLLPTAIMPASNNPNDAHPINRVMVGIGQQGGEIDGKNSTNSYLTFGSRAGFNDLLDRPTGYPQNFDFEGLSANVRVYDNGGIADRLHQDRIQLQDFTLIRCRSFNPVNSAKSGKTWGVNIGASRVNDGSDMNAGDHLVANAAYEHGISMAFGAPSTSSGELPPHLCYALANGAAQVGKGINNGWRIGVGTNLGCRYQFNTKLRAHAELQLPYWYHGDIDKTVDSKARGHYWQPIATLGMQYDIDRTQAVRLQGSYEFQEHVRDQDDVQLAYVKYF